MRDLLSLKQHLIRVCAKSECVLAGISDLFLEIVPLLEAHCKRFLTPLSKGNNVCSLKLMADDCLCFCVRKRKQKLLFWHSFF